MVWYTYVNGNLADADEVNANFAETPRRTQNETVYANWTFQGTTTTAKASTGYTHVIVDAVSGASSAYEVKLNGTPYWRIMGDNAQANKLKVYDKANSRTHISHYADATNPSTRFHCHVDFDADTRTLAGIQNQNLVDKTASETISGLWNYTTIPTFNSVKPFGILATNTTETSISGSGAGVGVTTLSSVAISSTTVASYILITANMKGYIKFGDSMSGTKYEFFIGEAGSETSKVSTIFMKRENASANHGQEYNWDSQTIKFFYSPTAGEKSNGFNVQLRGSVLAPTGTRSANAIGAIGCSQLIITGA